MYQDRSAAIPIRQKQADNRTLHLINYGSRTAHASVVSAGLARRPARWLHEFTGRHGLWVPSLGASVGRIKIDELCVTKGF